MSGRLVWSMPRSLLRGFLLSFGFVLQQIEISHDDILIPSRERPRSNGAAPKPHPQNAPGFPVRSTALIQADTRSLRRRPQSQRARLLPIAITKSLNSEARKSPSVPSHTTPETVLPKRLGVSSKNAKSPHPAACAISKTSDPSPPAPRTASLLILFIVPCTHRRLAVLLL